MTDADGRIVLVNREVERLFGYAREELLGQQIELLIPQRYHNHHPAYRQQFRSDPRARAMGAGRDLRGRRKDGTEVPLEVGLTPVVTEEGMFVIGSVVDISARKRAEEEQRAVSEQLRQAQKMEAVGTLAGGIAHDFNNLLGAIVGYAELVERAVIAQPEVHADVREILIAAQRGRSLVEHILTFSRRQEAQRKPLELARVVSEVQSLLRASIPAGIELISIPPTDSARVLADATSVHQVVMNLATNAAQAMPQGGRLTIALRSLYAHDSMIRANPALREGWYAELSVRDTGAGMDSLTQARAFEPFFTTKAPGKGTGLGLAVVHGIMRDHDGTVQLESNEGEGTEVRCLFPIIATEDAAVAQETDTQEVIGGGEHVLYVDDEATLVNLGVRRLQLAGYKVTGVTSPQDAIEVMRAQGDDIAMVITDYSMPHMNGLQLATALHDQNADARIVLLTGFVEEIPEQVLKAAGILRVLAKPITREQLVGVCHELLARE